MLGYVGLECRRLLRDSGFLVMSVLTPLVMYVVFNNLNVVIGQDPRHAALYTMISMSAFGAISGVLNSSVGVAEDRAMGWLRQLRLTPLSPLRIVLARVLISMLLAIPPVLSVCLAGVLVNDVALPADRWVSVVLLLWLGTAPFAAAGIAIGYLMSVRVAQLASIFVYIGLSLVGGLWIPLAAFPEWLADLARYTPTFSYADLSWRVVFEQGTSGRGLAVLAGWLVLGSGLAVYAYRRGGVRA
ncbi:ABC-2 type transport system permease protein [Crossiella equi]|uniref:ABC-2 type transport system permease protein n=1 Tax=Crossiella equi TaxID=130796 RepID=A0ABS5ARS9_9PSEU|nr:ABC transporter permease [Crossiella equi]MBP2479265.1 ABC-2 type transport system permease protein [Crossiella equi]